MDLTTYLKNDLITDNTQELSNEKIFLKTFQNSKYAQNIKNFITPSELLKSLNLKTKFIGITGTNGKTTTAFVLSFLLQKLGYKVSVQGTEGFFLNGKQVEKKTLTTPPILTTIKRAFKYNVDFFVMEVSSHAIVQNRIEGIDFYLKIFTSFSQDHLDFHETMDKYKEVKESYFQDDVFKVLKGNIKVKNDDFAVIEIDGYDFKVNSKNLYVLNKPIVDEIPMAGEFNKMNFSLALKAVSLICEKKVEYLKNFLKEFKGVLGRMEIVCKKPLIIVDFAHTPDGMEKVLSSVKGKKIVVFGAGGDRDRKKRPLMGKVADKYAEYIILTEDNPRCEDRKKISQEIAECIKNRPYEIILNRKDAIRRGIELAISKNLILFVLGKGDEKYIEYCNKKISYSDRDTIKKILKELT